jgi:hypothetical protein
MVNHFGHGRGNTEQLPAFERLQAQAFRLQRARPTMPFSQSREAKPSENIGYRDERAHGIFPPRPLGRIL